MIVAMRHGLLCIFLMNYLFLIGITTFPNNQQ